MKRKQNKWKKLAVLTMIAVLSLGFVMPVQAVSDQVIVYGERLTESERAEVRNILGVSDSETVEEYDVTGADHANYINGNPNSNMYSSAGITLEDQGAGLEVNILTPENITEVTNEMYENALLTAGAENATVNVVSPAAVSGHSALTGIYKAYDEQGYQLDQDRMELANEELNVATDISQNENVSEHEVSGLLTEIKQILSEQDPATREEVEQIVTEQMNNMELSLSEDAKQALVNLFDQMRNLNINFDEVANQLEGIADSVVETANEMGLDQGFWQNVANFFSNIFQAISDFFAGLFGSSEPEGENQ